MNYYKVLDVSLGSNKDEIEKAFLRKRQSVDKSDLEAVLELNIAYKTLTDFKLKAEYDKSIRAGSARKEEIEQRPLSDPKIPTEEASTIRFNNDSYSHNYTVNNHYYNPNPWISMYKESSIWPSIVVLAIFLAFAIIIGVS